MVTVRHYVDHGNLYKLGNCTATGIYPIPQNPSRFYSCTRNEDQYDQRIFQCPQGKRFCPVLKDCTEQPVKAVQTVSTKAIKNIFLILIWHKLNRSDQARIHPKNLECHKVHILLVRDLVSSEHQRIVQRIWFVNTIHSKENTFNIDLCK